jgi:hypothetical protein
VLRHSSGKRRLLETSAPPLPPPLFLPNVNRRLQLLGYQSHPMTGYVSLLNAMDTVGGWSFGCQLDGWLKAGIVHSWVCHLHPSNLTCIPTCTQLHACTPLRASLRPVRCTAFVPPLQKGPCV